MRAVGCGLLATIVVSSHAMAEPVGWTFEANVGLGLIYQSNDSGQCFDCPRGGGAPAVGGLDLGIGRWLSGSLAITLRIAGTMLGPRTAVTICDTCWSRSLIATFAGADLQYWITPRVWIGGGAGLHLVVDLPDANQGWGLDARIGYTLLTASEHSLNVSIEVDPGFYSRGTVTSLAFLVGYQLL